MMVNKVPRKLTIRRAIGLSWAVIFAFLFSWFAYYCVFSLIYKLKPYEQIVFFVKSYDEITGKPERFISIYNNEDLKKDGLMNVTYYSFNIYDGEAPSFKDALPEFDIAIINEEALIGYFSSSLNHDVLKIDEFADTKGVYEYGFDGYAIKIHDKDNPDYNKNFTYDNWITMSNSDKESSFYIIVSGYSQNFDVAQNHTLGYKALDIFLSENII